MAFNDYLNKRNQDIIRRHSAKIESWIPNSEIGTNLAVFGGNPIQRKLAVTQGIARCYGKMGIVVIHNNDYLEDDLMNFRNIYPELFAQYGNVPRCFIHNRNLCYEPFFGMSANRAVEIIYPEVSRESSGYMQQRLCSVALKAYMDILIQLGRPIDLKSLLYLCNMDPGQLDSDILSKLPSNIASDILATLVQENVYRQVKADVNYFATQLDGRIWDSRANSTNVSIIEAVKNKALICIKNPSNNNAVIDYLAMEMNSLLDYSLPYLLVVDSVNVGNSLLRNVIMNQNRRVSKIMSAGNISDLFENSVENGRNAIHKASKLILFQCPNVTVAQFYSQLVGEYFRKFTSVSGVEPGAFDFLFNKHQTSTVSEQRYARLEPEELVRLGEGAVLIDQVTGNIEVVRKLV